MTEVAEIELARYRRIVLMTGAGISVASGLPTYRGTGGLWNEVDVGRHATAAALEADPERVWQFFGQVRSQIAGALPNAAHLAIAHAEQRLNEHQKLTVITQTSMVSTPWPARVASSNFTVRSAAHAACVATSSDRKT